MKMKRHIRKFLIVSFWLAVTVGVMVLLVAAMSVQQHKICKRYSIKIKGEAEKLFLDKKDVEALLISQGGVKGRTLKRFDLRKMENQLKSNVWIKDAELFF